MKPRTDADVRALHEQEESNRKSMQKRGVSSHRLARMLAWNAKQRKKADKRKRKSR